MSRRHDDWFADSDVDNAHIFVPAIMGAGILISVLTLARDALHTRQWRGRARRVALEARATAHHVLAGEPANVALRAGVRPRASYLLSGVSSGALALYVGIGATANYLRTGGYVVGIVWLWALSLATTAVLGAVAVACLAAFVRWPELARWQLPLLAHTPLGQRPEPAGAGHGRPPLLLGWAAAGAGAAAAIFTFVVAAAPHRIDGVDGWVARAVEPWGFADALVRLDLFGPNPTYLVFVAVIGLATLRCPPVTLAYLACVAGGLLLDAGLQALVPRDRPPAGPLAGGNDSFPSGHEIQATLIAVFLPLAIVVLWRRRRLAAAAAAVLGVGLVAAAVGTMHAGLHWWSDVLAGALWGGALALAALWALGHRRWHRHCADCPWSAPRRPADLGTIRLPDRAERLIRAASRVWVPVAVATFVVLATVVGLPANPEGDALTSQVEGPAQLAMLVLAAIGWLVAWKWEAPAAVLLAIAGSMLGVLAALAYHPMVSVPVAAAFLAPAVGFWLVWQHRRTVRAVVVLGLTTALVFSGTWAGASLLYDRFYGPAHPSSAERALPVDRVVWAWTGGVTAGRATIVAELAAGSRQARVRLEPQAVASPGDASPDGGADGTALRGGGADSTAASAVVGAARTSAVVAAGADRVVRLSVDGLAAGTAYRYRIEVDGVPDASRGSGTFRTMPDAAASFTIAFGACARTGSSGAVFDAIAALRPALYVATGDLHYGNPSADDVGVFANLYRRTLTAPAQAALYRDVPVAYVWDDHDYGPNDADATAPTRPAARAAYARYVPHHPLSGGAIYQAFSMGRVRVVLTDTRSERTAGSMLGDRQLAWLEQELVIASRSHALVVWVNPDPWIAPADPTGDDWGAYPEERRRLADTIAGAGIRNLVMVSGDAHMTAIDDGTNTDFSAAGTGGFPLLHAAALDRPGGVKGGPYSEGAFPGAGQFGTLTLVDTGGPSVGVTLTGRNWRGEVLTSYELTVDVPPAAS